MSKIVDNENVKLVERLKEALPHSKHLDACVGYFNLRGWQQIQAQASNLKFRNNDESPVRLLVGMALSEDAELRQQLMMNASGTSANVDLGKAIKMAEQAVTGFVKQLTWGLPTKKDMDSLRALRDDLSLRKITVKFAARHPLHAKLYICHLENGLGGFRATVGSSNLTKAGLGGQGELNLEETDQETANDLFIWFDKKWNDQFTIDITDELIRIIDESWAQTPQPSPYLIHLRLAYELSRDARNGLLLDIPENIRKDLLPHQESAVRVATQMLERKGLAVIGDVVGLGKTLSGTAIAASIGETVLVICPKNLVKMWKSVLDHYAVPSRVISLSMVDKELPTLRRYKLLLVDESHNLRHKTRLDWQAIRAYVELNDPMVVLMTATMFNANHFDISGQLALKIDPDLDLGIRPEKYIENFSEIDLAAKTGGKLTTLNAFNKSEFVEDWQRLLSQFLVRRTRRFLEANYGEKEPGSGKVFFTFPNGEKFSFPKRVAEPLAYVGGADDPGEQLASEENFRSIGKLTFARYQLGEYLMDGATGKSPEEQQYLEDLKKSKTTAAGFIRTTAFKRLASSPHAFLTTVDRMLLKNRMLEYALVNSKLLPVGSYSESGITVSEADDFEGDISEFGTEFEDKFHHAAKVLVYGEISTMQAAEYSYEELSIKSPRGLKWMRPELFKTESLLKNLRKDSKFLQSLITEYGNWDPNKDSKLDALENLVLGLEPKSKVLVFSEYADTVEYVYAGLKDRLPGASIEKASSKTVDPTEIARRFSPISNEEIGGLPNGESEIDILLTTDVLSEGQNLQDCAIVVNWDMPWTIIKIIQRAGRVDRVGQKAETIRVLTFLAQDGVEGRIGNLQRLKSRLNAAKEIIGHDEDFFNDLSLEEDLVDGLFDGSADLIGDEGDVDYASLALGVWNSATKENQELALNLGLGTHSTKHSVEDNSVLLYCQTDSGLDVIARALTNKNAIPTTLAPIDGLKLTECSPDEFPGLEIDDFFEYLEHAYREGVVQQLDQAMVLAHSGIRKRLFVFLNKFRDQYLGTLFDLSETEEILEALLKAPIRKTSEKKIVDLLRIANKSNDSLSVMSILVEMYRADELLDLTHSTNTQPNIVVALGLRKTSRFSG